MSQLQHQGEPWRILFAFDPKRQAILLIGGNKAGNKKWMLLHNLEKKVNNLHFR